MDRLQGSEVALWSECRVQGCAGDRMHGSGLRCRQSAQFRVALWTELYLKGLET